MKTPGHLEMLRSYGRSLFGAEVLLFAAQSASELRGMSRNCGK